METRLLTDKERMDALESQLAFQEETIQQLSDALIAQQKRIDVLEGKLEQLLTMRSEEPEADSLVEIPPHY